MYRKIDPRDHNKTIIDTIVNMLRLFIINESIEANEKIDQAIVLLRRAEQIANEQF